MARGRHRRRSGLLSRLRPRRRSRLDALTAEAVRWRRLTEVGAATATAALVRAVAAQDAAAAAELRAVRAEAAAAALLTELSSLRGELAALREELVWAFAERRAEARPEVIDLRERAVAAVQVV
jgi:hypothetical protein